MSNYTTAQKAADLLGIDVASINSDWIIWADARVEEKTKKQFKEVAIDDELYDGNDNDELVLNVYPITCLTKIEYTEDYGVTWTTLPTTCYTYYANSGIIRLFKDSSSDYPYKFTEGANNWRISYEYGYVEVPTIVELLATLVVAEFYNISTTGASGTIASEKIGDYSISYDNGGTAPVASLINEIANQIKNSNIGVKGFIY